MAEVGVLVFGVGSRGSDLESESGMGCGRSSWGVSGRSVGFCAMVSVVCGGGHQGALWLTSRPTAP
jgi:hypothetical protein